MLVGFIFYKQYKFFTTLPPFATQHMELMCDHHFKHPPCLERDDNGNSDTRASGIYTREMLLHIISIVGMAAGRPRILYRVSAFVQSVNSSLHENNGVECFHTFKKAMVDSYLYKNADWANDMHESYGMSTCRSVAPTVCICSPYLSPKMWMLCALIPLNLTIAGGVAVGRHIYT